MPTFSRKDLLARSWFWAALISLTALVLRLIYFFQFKSTVYFNHLQIDSQYYWQWAGRIVQGEILGDSVFDMSPLYPYLLGVYRYFIGESFTPLYLIQLCLGTGTVLLLFLLAKRLYGLKVGILAGFILAMYKPAIMFDVMVMKSFLTSLMLVGMAYLLVTSERFSASVFAGVLLALTCANDGSYLLLTPFIIYWIFLADQTWRRRVLAYMLGMLIVFTPIALRNYYVSGEFILLRTGGGTIFYMGSIPEFAGEYYTPAFVPAHPKGELTAFPEEARKRTGNPNLSVKQASNYWFREGLKLIKAQPLVYLKNVGRRLMILWNAYERPDNYDYQFLPRLIPFLGWPLLDFVTIGGLGLWGLSLQICRERRLNLISLIVLGCTISLLPFYVFDRLRLGMIPFVIIAAAWGIVAGVKILIDQDKKAQISMLSGLALAILIVNYPLKLERVDILAGNYTNLGSLYIDDNRPEEALNCFISALRADRTFISALKNIEWLNKVAPLKYPGLKNKLRAAQIQIAAIYVNAGLKELAAENYAGAVGDFNLALGLELNNLSALLGATEALLGQGKYDLAAAYLRKASQLAPQNPQVQGLQTILAEQRPGD